MILPHSHTPTAESMKMQSAIMAGLPGLLLSLAAPAGTTLEVVDPWVREAPPAATVHAAYMTIRNPDTSPAEIGAITSPDFKRSELHRTIIEDSVASMAPVATLVIPAASEISMQPGGMHLMLFDPQRPLRAGDSVTLTVHRAGGASVTVTAPVIRSTGESDHHHHH